MLHYYGENYQKTLPETVTLTGYLNFRIYSKKGDN